jgi:D-alanyl-D-alanine carboxypeptidase (penicillin-binding protein 5/6)
MLAYLVVQQKPLQPGQTGPTLTMTQSDVDLYTNYLKQNGSVVPVSLDEKISEYQMLQALLLPSGDNIADSLAIWAYGSTANYLTTANQEASKLGLAQTHFDDACGLSPNTVSSAQNLVVLGSLVLNEPILADIVGQSEVTLPVAGMEHNVDSLLGKNGIIGIKTGNTDEAGGCFLFAVKESVGSSSYTTIGAILGSTGLNSVLADTTAFLQNNPTAVTEISPVSQGQVVGSYTTAWGQSITAIAKSDLLVYVAGNQHVVVKVSLDKITQPTKEGTVVGKITAQTGQSTVSVPAVLASSLTRPRITWQLLHP